MSLMESWRISVQRSGKRTRWTLFGLGTLMTSLGVFTVFASHGDVWEKLVLLGGTVFFGAVSLIYLLLAREAERPD